MYFLQKYATHYQNLHSEVHRFDAAREIHEKLSKALSQKETFFGYPVREEFKEERDYVRSDLRVSSLDLVAYAYLKEELVNTPDSQEVKYLKSNFKNLIKFVDRMDAYFSSETTG